MFSSSSEEDVLSAITPCGLCGQKFNKRKRFVEHVCQEHAGDDRATGIHVGERGEADDDEQLQQRPSVIRKLDYSRDIVVVHLSQEDEERPDADKQEHQKVRSAEQRKHHEHHQRQRQHRPQVGESPTTTTTTTTNILGAASLIRSQLFAQWRVGPHALVGAERDDVVARLSSMIAASASSRAGVSSDVVLYGGRGAGKTCAWRCALERARVSPACVLIELHGELHCDFGSGTSAVRAINVALRQQTQDAAPRGKMEGFAYTRRRLVKIASDGGCAIFVLERAELFTSKKGKLLYKLLDMEQDPELRVFVIIVTECFDFMSKLEKRVRSRLKANWLLFPSLTLRDCVHIVAELLTVAGDHPQLCEYNKAIADLTSADSALYQALNTIHRINNGDVRPLVRFAMGLTMRLTDDHLIPSSADLQKGARQLLNDQWTQKLLALSEVEWCLIIVAGKTLRHAKSPLTFYQLNRVYHMELKNQTSKAYEKNMVWRAFSSLVDARLLLAVKPGEISHQSVVRCEVPWYLISSVMKKAKKSNSRQFPTYLEQWASAWLE